MRNGYNVKPWGPSTHAFPAPGDPPAQGVQMTIFVTKLRILLREEDLGTPTGKELLGVTFGHP